MITNLALMILICMGNVYASDTSKRSFIEKIKHSSVTAKVFGGVVPCIATFVAMDGGMKAHKDDLQKHTSITIDDIHTLQEVNPVVQKID